MGEVNGYFFDTYAFIEIISGNPRYHKYTQKVSIITSKLNLMELHYGLIRKYNESDADRCYDELVHFSVEPSDSAIKDASKFRHLFKSRNLSYVDCLGYVLAKKFNIKFLTGDEGFKDMENVEFVK